MRSWSRPRQASSSSSVSSVWVAGRVTAGSGEASRRRPAPWERASRDLCYRPDRHEYQPRSAPAPSAQRRTAKRRELARPGPSPSASPSSSSPRSSCWASSGSSPRSAPTASTARTCPTPSPSSTTSASTSRRSSTTGPATVELARFGQTHRQVIDIFAQLSPVLVDATTAVEDQTFWSNAGFDPVGIISAAVAHGRRQRPRRLDDHPAARPGPAPARERLPGLARTTARSARSSSRSG